MDSSQLAFTASLIAGLSTGLGALPILFVHRPSPPATTALLGFGAGIGTAAAVRRMVVTLADARVITAKNDVAAFDLVADRSEFVEPLIGLAVRR
jgi:ZIP family zinc transporter